MKNLKFKKLILNNFALKILAVILAVVAWIVIVNIDNPSRTTTISGIQVNLLNEDKLIDQGYTYNIQSGSVISISVKAPQTIVEKLEASDFYAYADLGEMKVGSEKAPIVVRCEKTDVANQVDIVALKTQNVTLSIDNKLSKDFVIEGSYTGEVAEGYVAGECYVSPTTVTVTGAETVVNEIAKAKVNYNISNLTQNVSEDVRIVFYDKLGKEIKSDSLALSRTTAKISIEINPIKKVNINYAITGTPEDGYVMVDNSATIGSAMVAASKELLDRLTSIDIPAGVIDIEGVSADKSFDVVLATYLPSGYRIVSSQPIMTVNVKISRKIDVDIPYEQIKLSGCSDAYNYEIVHTATDFPITIIGDKAVVEKLKAEDFYLSVAMAGKTIGTHTVRLDIEDGNKYNISGKYEITVKVSEKKEPETTSPEITTTEDETKETEN